MSKRRAETVFSEKSQFIEAAQARGYSAKDATVVFEHILEHVDTAALKSHWMSQMVIAARCAWFKAYFPDEWARSL